MTGPTVTDDAPVALLTGAARGLGAATARRLAADGWRLVLVDRCADDPALRYALATEDELYATAAACGGPDHATTVVGDVRDRTALAAAVGVARTRFGGLDAAVGLAGVIEGGVPLWDMPDDQWDAVIDVNLTGIRNLAAAAIPAMLERREPRRGRFVAIASAAALGGYERIAAYTAAKAGVVGLVKGVAAELASTGITANAICPGSTDTPILAASAALYGLTDVEAFAQNHTDKRILRPEELAAAIAWVLSADASAVTGATLPVDGGMSV